MNRRLMLSAWVMIILATGSFNDVAAGLLCRHHLRPIFRWRKSVPRAVPLECKVLDILRQNGFEPEAIPDNTVSLSDEQVADISTKWVRVQESLELLFQREFRLPEQPMIFLILRESTVAPGVVSRRFILRSPAQIARVLDKIFSFDFEYFVAEAAFFTTSSLKPGLVRADGKMDLFAIQGVIWNILQADKSLATAARDVNGDFKPIVLAGALTARRLFVYTEWQPLAADANRRLYWRARIRVEGIDDSGCMLESWIEFGERYRSQSFDQVRKVFDSNRLGYLAFIEESDGPAGTRDHAVMTASERLVRPQLREKFGDLASLLFQKVNDTVRRPVDNENENAVPPPAPDETIRGRQFWRLQRPPVRLGDIVPVCPP